MAWQILGTFGAVLIIGVSYIWIAFCLWLFGLATGSFNEENWLGKLLSPIAALLWLPLWLWPKKFEQLAKNINLKR